MHLEILELNILKRELANYCLIWLNFLLLVMYPFDRRNLILWT